jgi:hypothetical protein
MEILSNGIEGTNAIKRFEYDINQTIFPIGNKGKCIIESRNTCTFFSAQDHIKVAKNHITFSTNAVSLIHFLLFYLPSFKASSLPS